MPERKYSPEIELKPKKDLNKQIEAAQVELGKSPEVSLTPPSENKRDILKMSAEEIKTKFARRYEIYLKLLREEKYFQRTGEAVLTEENIDEMKKWLTALNSLDSYIESHKEGEINTLRDRQFTVFEDMRKFLEAGGNAGYVKLPTGVGKTVLFTEFIEALNLKTIVVVPTTILVQQTREKTEQFASDLDVGKVYGKAKEFGRQVTIITYDSFIDQIKNGKINPDEYDCLVLDEAHTSLSPARQQAVNKFDKAVRIGFTATPDYSENKKLENLLPEEIHSMSIREAVEEELISPFSSIVVKTKADLSKVSLTTSGELNEVQLARAVNIESRNKAAAEVYKKGFKDQLAIAYCVGIEHAAKVAQTFNEAGVSAAHISGKMSDKIQQKLLDKFHKEEIKVLCNADLLIAGFDEPKSSVCLNLRPTRSRVNAEQRGGRVLRIDETNPEKHANVVDFIDEGMENNPPVLFADIADGAQISPNKKRKGKGGTGGGYYKPPIIDVPGLEVITETEEIMRLVGKNREKDKTSEKKEFLSFQELQKEVQAVGVTNKEEYKSNYKKYSGWPSSPPYSYEDLWLGWPALFGKEVKFFLPFDQFQEEVLTAGIKSESEYHIKYKQHQGWPSVPEATYKEKWEGWPAFFGKEKNIFLTFSKFTVEVRAAQIKSSIHYREVYKQHPGWPSTPDRVYKDEWKDWEDLLLNRLLGFDEVQRRVRALGLKSQIAYIRVYKQHPGWPSSPNVYYGDQWQGWEKFFGKEKKEFLPFEQFVSELKVEHIANFHQYKKVYKKHIGWPSRPEISYKDQWPGWPAFLGKK